MQYVSMMFAMDLPAIDTSPRENGRSLDHTVPIPALITSPHLTAVPAGCGRPVLCRNIKTVDVTLFSPLHQGGSKRRARGTATVRGLAGPHCPPQMKFW